MDVAIFRIVQEALVNIHRHADSKTATIRVARERDHILVEVQDQGRGMSSERLTEVLTHGVGIGIRAMRERVRQFHGELEIESNALGTKICATLQPPAIDQQHSKSLSAAAVPPLRDATRVAADD